MRRAILRPAAEADVLSTIRWYDEERPGLGDAFIAALNVTLRRVAHNPHIYPFVLRPIRRAMVDRFPFGAYFVLESDGTARVLAVTHLHRDADSWRSRL